MSTTERSERGGAPGTAVRIAGGGMYQLLDRGEVPGDGGRDGGGDGA